MQQQSRNSRDDELSQLLGGWRVGSPLPPRFHEAVWRRIAGSQERRYTWFGFGAALVSRWESLIRKPVGAAAFLTLFAAAGIGFGLWHAKAFTLQAETAWQNAYFQSVNPTATAQRE